MQIREWIYCEFVGSAIGYCPLDDFRFSSNVNQLPSLFRLFKRCKHGYDYAQFGYNIEQPVILYSV